MEWRISRFDSGIAYCSSHQSCLRLFFILNSFQGCSESQATAQLSWPHNQVVKILPFHGRYTGSNPVGVIAILVRLLKQFFSFQWAVDSQATAFFPYHSQVVKRSKTMPSLAERRFESCPDYCMFDVSIFLLIWL